MTKPDEEGAAMAHDVAKRDKPNEKEHRSNPAEKALDDWEKVYRPNENVDNEKSPEGQVDPGHNSSIEQTPISGKQLREKPFQKENIRDATDDSESPRRDG